jgi:hypothetical protein
MDCLDKSASTRGFFLFMALPGMHRALNIILTGKYAEMIVINPNQRQYLNSAIPV